MFFFWVVGGGGFHPNFFIRISSVRVHHLSTPVLLFFVVANDSIVIRHISVTVNSDFHLAKLRLSTSLYIFTRISYYGV